MSRDQADGAHAEPTVGYAVTLCEFAYNEMFLESTLLYAGGSGTRRAPFSFAVLQGRDRLCLVDTGVGDTPYQRRIATKQGLTALTSADERLADLDLTASEVTDVLVTHAHYDHFGNIDSFPNATFHIQRRELEEWLHALALPPHLRYFNESIDPATLDAADRLRAEGRLNLLEGDVVDLLPGIDARAAHDTHTFGSMWFTVTPADGGAPLILVGDNVYCYESLTGVAEGKMIIPIGQATGSNFGQMICIDEILTAAGGEPTRVLPFHEGRVADLYDGTRNRAGLALTAVCR